MEMLGMALMAIGGIAACVGSIWLIVTAFQESVMWGLGTLVIPLVGLIFVVSHWDRAAKPFLINVGGAVVMILGMMLAGDGKAGVPQ